ncbi:uncharacterized protein THITE_2036996 [Thermothielavioides terrestris NRRL 8126]|uniref:Protein kinase domain-containing protein n=1 Tax=Thermothielavioides terrestris (strain ATCC 38088 / NRRL 8126) TaxID=578455 RepID=G2QV42_THETT|nr:uncharacterized protein THITE_2036996 [Thermothielavioides terrestris NRRL 8126]AEO62929.1 hypothetical protein THITE_2036996 [Thermothielavioides terrestris NRRL 8126]
MFTFPSAGCVETGKAGYAFIFDSKLGESYIYLEMLGVGSQSTVQLVANIFTHEVAVRKVSKRKLPLKDMYDLTKLREDREVRILDYLESVRLNPVHPQPALTPRWTTCISHDDFPVMSDGPKPKLVCTRVTYLKLCNSGTLVDWSRDWTMGRDLGDFDENGCFQPAPKLRRKEAPRFPVCILARCIAQVCETLHVMYQAGPEAVYHCDLHTGNVFVHLDRTDGSDDDALPDFYIGDFGWSRTATESLADSVAMYKMEQARAAGTTPPGRRRRWDVTRFASSLGTLISLAKAEKLDGDGKAPAGEKQQKEARAKAVAGLEQLIGMIQCLDEQDALMAAKNDRSRPPWLMELVREAKELEQVALAAERDSEYFRAFMALVKHRAAELNSAAEKPYVFTGGAGLTHELAKASAETYGRVNIPGPWSLIESV